MGFAGINKLSLLDYPGKICSIIYTNKCNFRCPFCHNGLTLLDCEESISDEELFNFLESRKGKLDAVTITGGEPTLLTNLKDYIIKIKKLGYFVKLDTNGTNPKLLKELIDEHLIDYVAMDIKNSLNKYPITVGVNKPNLKLIKESIDVLNNSLIDHEFRTTLIKEFHDEISIKEIGELLKESNKLFLQKYKLSDGVFNKNLHQVDEDLAICYKDILSQYIKNVELRGY